MAHAMYTSIKYEDINTNEWLAITLSPQKQHNDTIKGGNVEWELVTKNRPEANMKYIQRSLKNLKGSRYRLYLEYSPLGIIHYHGYIKIIDKTKWMTNDILLYKDIGHFYIKKIGNIEEWQRYITKQNTGLSLNSLIEID